MQELFDREGGFEQAAELQKKQKRGCKGIDYGGKPCILDAMEMITKMWMSVEEKYVSETSAQTFWHKADILPEVSSFFVLIHSASSLQFFLQKLKHCKM